MNTEGPGGSTLAQETGDGAPNEGTVEATRAEGGGEHREGGESSERRGGDDGGEHREGSEAGEQREGGEGGEHGDGGEGGEHREGGEGGEHGDGGHDEGGEGEGEESGVYIGRADTWDAVRRGARLVLEFDSGSNAFVGSVENTTGSMLCAVRVEVHLSSGTELGPTERTDLTAGRTTSVQLPTGGEGFDTWTAHPELSACSAA